MSVFIHLKKTGESTNSLSREARGLPQAGGGNKLQVADFFFFSLLILFCHGDTWFLPEISFISNLELWILEKVNEFQKNIYFFFIHYTKAFDCIDQNKLWKILQEMGIPDRLTCLLRNPYAGQEGTIKTGRGTTDWFQIGIRVHQGCISSPCLFNL